MTFWSAQSRPLLVATLVYTAVWLAALLAWRMEAGLPAVVLAAAFAPAIPLAIAWTRALRTSRDTAGIGQVATLFYVYLWTLAVFAFDALALRELAGGVLFAGAFGLFFIGLLWVVWFLERGSRRIELARIEAAQSQGLAIPHGEEDDGPATLAAGKRLWNPIDPAAWYYGREGRKLKQSTAAFFAYSFLFWLGLTAVSQIGGCQQIYELPAGGGQQKTVAQTVRIQKVIRKKFVVNKYSSIKFEVPPIDEVKLKLQEVTAHQYTIGYGEGTGAGFAGGTSKGKVRLMRLEYDGGDWDLNFGVGGDNNMLMEYHLLTQQQASEKAESLRISQLARFPREKSPPVVFLTGQKNLSVANNEIKTLREYLLDKHGMVFASSGSPHFHNQFMSLMSRVLPDIRPVPVPMDDTIHRVPFAIPSFPYVVPHGGREPLGWSLDGRWIAYYHPGDISDAWADGHAGVSADVYNGCYQLGANVINYGHVEYSKWLQAKGK